MLPLGVDCPSSRIGPVRASARSFAPDPARAAASARPLRVAQVLGYAGTAGQRYGMTGVERVVQLLVEGFDSRRFEHYLVYPEIGVLFARLRDRCRAILPLEAKRRFDPHFVPELERFVRAHDLQVV